MISSLKDKAREQFRTSFTDCSEKDLFAEVIKELYSERANYQELKTLAIHVVVNSVAVGHAADLSKLSEIEKLVERLKSEPRVDILVANAAATWGAFEPTPDSAVPKFSILTLEASLTSTAFSPRSLNAPLRLPLPRESLSSAQLLDSLSPSSASTGQSCMPSRRQRRTTLRRIWLLSWARVASARMQLHRGSFH
jgi:NAD(P)-dependent dehydrogenase (short-subunit alcohol dehydrogenase family)